MLNIALLVAISDLDVGHPNKNIDFFVRTSLPLDHLADKLRNPSPTGGSKKVTFIKNKKKVTRVVRINKRGTQVVNYDGKLIPLSKLKLV